MSASLTADTINQGLSYGALAAVIAGVPPEVALGSLAGAVILLPLQLSIRSSAVFSWRYLAFSAAFSSTNPQHQSLSALPA